MHLAALAAENGLTAFSIRAVRETLGGGSPVGGEGREVLSDASVALLLDRIATTWDAHDADPDAVAAVLLDIVLPPEHSEKVFPYLGRDNALSDDPPNSAVGLLSSWSARADKSQAIRTRLATRTDESAKALIETYLAVANGDAEAPLASLRKKVWASEDRRDAELAAHAAVAALDADVASIEAAVTLEAAVGVLAVDERGNLALLRRLAREKLRWGNADRGSNLIERYLELDRLRGGVGAEYLLATERRRLIAAATDYVHGVEARAKADDAHQADEVHEEALDKALGLLKQLDGLPHISESRQGVELPADEAALLLEALAALPAKTRVSLLAQFTRFDPDGERPNGQPIGPTRAPLHAIVAPGPSGGPPVIGTLELLATSAKEIGRENELTPVFLVGEAVGKTNAADARLTMIRLAVLRRLRSPSADAKAPFEAVTALLDAAERPGEAREIATAGLSLAQATTNSPASAAPRAAFLRRARTWAETTGDEAEAWTAVIDALSAPAERSEEVE
ncbi:hypothetical protein LzC2_41120 [Planctomycetes bacterium LzC2]|uniref:Uncharacterized protein n=1 Tax=Alienimonas chondri TaxID=2681879 RepID=A0ABX1VIT7_9PLAN|nr:hypothetical protein [Alienimonas chondri]